jgi:hypothetical protein
VSPAAKAVVYTGSCIADRLSIRHEVEAFLTKDRDGAYLVHPGGDDPPGRPPDDMASRARNGAPATVDRPARPPDNRPPRTAQAVTLTRRRRILPARAI